MEDNATDIDQHFADHAVEEVLEAADIDTLRSVDGRFYIGNITLCGDIERIVVQGSDRHKTYSVWWRNGAGTIEFDLKDGQIALIDSYGCDFSYAEGHSYGLHVCPHTPGGERLNWGKPSGDGPKSSAELLDRALRGKR